MGSGKKTLFGKCLSRAGFEIPLQSTRRLGEMVRDIYVANPTTFVDYATVNFNPTAGSDPTASRVQISDSTGIVANNVAAIRFTFDQPAAPENGYTGYTEIDVIGQAMPEPTAMGLVALGAAGLLARRRN